MPEKPAILIVDDDPAVLASVARDLRPRYGADYRILRADSGQTALETTRELLLRGDAVALFLIDQRMPGMSGVEFLVEAIALYPDARRVLLTAYADTEAAIRAINEVQLNHYLMKPWHPPEEQLYPVIDDVLSDWRSSYFPAFEGIRLIGHRWSSAAFDMRYLLSRNLIPFQWMDIEHDPDARMLLEQAGASDSALPVLIFPDGSVLAQPNQQQVAEKVGLRTRAEMLFYDLIIVGGGPAGLAAAVYGASEGLRTVVIEREAPGGQAGTSSRIENYLGFPAGLSGADLARRGVAQAQRLGAEFLTGEVTSVRLDGNYRVVRLADGAEINCLALLVATGVQYRTLDVPGVERLTGAGVYYGGALSEAISTRGEDVYVAGGANSAGQAAMHFAMYARQVTLLVRGNDLGKSGMSQYLIDQIDQTENIHVCLNTNVVEALGDDHLTGLRLAHTDSTGEESVPAHALFIFIGAKPYTDWIKGVVAVDGQGFVLTGAEVASARSTPSPWPLKRQPFWLETSVPGIFVAGDVRHRSMKRIASATGEGAMAISFIHQYLGGL
ncbi:MAG TPA: FAD-dependent oxidoreductase [Thermomicrobiales bacterium]|nr:FAD-dependent oxidoreductase [Thermomicrobiales bacterium]